MVPDVETQIPQRVEDRLEEAFLGGGEGTVKDDQQVDVRVETHVLPPVAANGDLLDQVGGLQRKTLEILTQAERVGNQRTMLLAVEQSRRNLELQAKLLGELKPGKTVNILGMPEWLELKARLMAALQPYPEALAAVYEAVEG